MRLYLDASTIIYSIESVAEFRAAALRWIDAAEATEGGALITSRLSRLECRSKPLGDGNQDLLALYDGFFADPDLVIVDVSAEVLERATELRARHRLRSADSIHLASALHERADVLVAGDHHFRRVTELRVEIITDPEPSSL